MDIPFSTFHHMHEQIRAEMMKAFEKCYDNGWFIQGTEYKKFEKEFAQYCGASFGVGVGNGLDAISLSLQALGIGEGDEVIVPAHTFIATALAVKYAGAKPVLCDVCADTFTIDSFKIEPMITEKTKAIIAVQLYGQTADMTAISHIAKEHNLWVIEDAAQAHGATFHGKRTGTLGDVAAFSLYPGKNLGALGDGGAVVTNREEIAERIHELGCYGSKVKYVHDLAGINSRLDEIQASFLRIKLHHLEKWTEERQAIAKTYLQNIENSKLILPKIGSGREHVWHLFVIRCPKRDHLQAYLEEKGIHTQIHYPIPMHLQKSMQYLGYGKGSFPISEEIAESVLSLPLYIGMTEREIEYVCEIMNCY